MRLATVALVLLLFKNANELLLFSKFNLVIEIVFLLRS